MIEEKTNKSKTLVYISGKGTGILTEHEEKKFQIAENFLISIGMKAINPMKNCTDETTSDQEKLIKDLKLLLTANTIFILENWSNSAQMRMEKKMAEEQGMQIMYESNIYKNHSGIELMKECISEVMNLSFKDYTSRSRRKELFFARMILIEYCRNIENMNLHQIGDLMDRNHTTILHSLKTFKIDKMYNVEFRNITEAVYAIFNK